MPPPPPAPLPIDALASAFHAASRGGPVVITAPTGSGKSTRVPTWAPRPVLVIEPRRVACRSLARRVAEQEGARLGHEVGYHVKDDRCATDATAILFATPGVALRWLAGRNPLPFATVILDELHERSLDVDLLLALLLARPPAHLVAMSATLDARRVADHLGATLLSGEGRLYPVTLEHLGDPTALPSARDLEPRVAAAVAAAAGAAGDILVFLPGKAEIARVADHLASRCPHELLALHGALSAAEQDRAFAPGPRRRVILATNVAETSLTLPRIGVVIDAGLVRRTRYHRGRGVLTLAPVAQDSADQRAGRAGRLGPGVCYRLWGRAARLDPVTPPEIARESLVPLVLGAAACGAPVRTLRWLDPPAAHAVVEAERELAALGALDAGGAVTDAGRLLFGWPLDPALGRVLIEARARGTLADALDLVAALGVDRPLFPRAPAPHAEREPDDLRAAGCDAVALIRAIRRGRPAGPDVDPRALDEALALRARLGALLAPPKASAPAARPEAAVDRHALALTLLAADPLAAHVARRRRGQVLWASGGPELELGRESAVDEARAEAVIVLAERAIGDARSAQLIATAAMPVPLPWLVEAGVGTERLASPSLSGGRVVATVERVHAGRALSQTDRPVSGALLREAAAALFARGTLFRGGAALAAERLEAWELWRRVAVASASQDRAAASAVRVPSELADAPSVEALALARLEAVGLEAPEDLPLVSRDDLLPPPLPPDVQALLDREFPRTVRLPDATYAVSYDFAQRRALLVQREGSRKDPPSLTLLPPFRGLSVAVQAKSRVIVLRP